jgi:hypothetical protein
MGTSLLLADDNEDSAMLFDELLFQTLCRIELINPLRLPNHTLEIVGNSLLADGMVLHFDDSAMVCTSPRQNSRCQHGTTLRLSENGERQALGYRLTLLDSEDVDPLFSVLSLPQNDSGKGLDERRMHEHATILLLADVKQIDGLWAISMRFLNGRRYSLVYRPDHSCIAFSPEISGTQ